jgi:hypothetical protein
MKTKHTCETSRANRQKAKPPPATTSNSITVYNITRIELEKIQLAKPEHERNT